MECLTRIERAIEAASEILRGFTPGNVEAGDKGGGDPVTEADLAVDAALKKLLPRGDEGWLSEETADDARRLKRRRVWVVDPLDGTREFVQGIPEWCVSIGLVEDGRAIAGGICNPASGETILGGIGVGVTYNGEPATMSQRVGLDGAVVLASNSEINRGEWRRFEDTPISVKPCGSVAYKLGLVAAGRADATWTLVPKHEWDIAAGAALIAAGGGEVYTVDGAPARFNRPRPKVAGLIAHASPLGPAIRELLGI